MRKQLPERVSVPASKIFDRHVLRMVKNGNKLTRISDYQPLALSQFFFFFPFFGAHEAVKRGLEVLLGSGDHGEVNRERGDCHREMGHRYSAFSSIER